MVDNASQRLCCADGRLGHCPFGSQESRQSRTHEETDRHLRCNRAEGARSSLLFHLRGSWRDIPLRRIIAIKREIDRTFHAYGDLFSEDFQRTYHDFINAGFLTYQGVGKPAALRANREYLRRQWGGDWEPAWDGLFVGPNEIWQSRSERSNLLASGMFGNASAPRAAGSFLSGGSIFASEMDKAPLPWRLGGDSRGQHLGSAWPLHRQPSVFTW